MRLTCTSKSDSGSTSTPARCADSAASACLFARLTARHSARNAGVLGERLERGAAASRSQTQPSPIARVTSADEPGVDERHEAPRRDAVGHVRELLRPELARSRAAARRCSSSRVQRRDAVDRVARRRRRGSPCARSAGPLSSISDSALHARLVAREAHAHLVEEAPVDLVDDLEVARQHRAEQRQRPLLERLGQQRVVRVGEGPAW